MERETPIKKDVNADAMAYRRISLEELKHAHFAAHDVLSNAKEIQQRHHDLTVAMAFTNTEHDEVGIIIQLVNGEQVEYLSDFIEFEESIVELKGGHAIPVKTIVKIEM